ncbi:Para-hydroxybenzoate--polyprenyltransferase, mitochondrial precursor (PHB:polyprenyltransferase), partial [Physocladia obscura]
MAPTIPLMASSILPAMLPSRIPSLIPTPLRRCAFTLSLVRRFSSSSDPTPIVPRISKLEPFPQHLSRLPAWSIPYIRLARIDRPAGSYLLFLPCSWSIAMANYAHLAATGTATTLVFAKTIALFAA